MIISPQVIEKLKAKGYNDDQIAEVVTRKGYEMPNRPAEKSFVGDAIEDVGETIGGMGGSLRNRWKELNEPKSEDETFLQSTLRSTKAVAGAVGDVVGGAFLGAGKVLLPESAERAISNVASGVFGSAPVQGTAEKYQEWKKEHPDAALALEAGLNVADVATLGAGSGVKKTVASAMGKMAPEGTQEALKSGAESLRQSVTNTSGEQIAKMVLPQDKKLGMLGGDTPTQAASKTGMNTSTLLGGNVAPFYAVPQIRGMVDDLRDVISPRDTSMGNVQNKLVKSIDEVNNQRNSMPPATPFNTKDLRTAFTDIKTQTIASLPETPNSEAVAQFIIDGLQKVWNKRDGMNYKYDRTHLGFHNALKDWKKEITQELGENAFNPTTTAGLLRTNLVRKIHEKGRDVITEAIRAKSGDAPAELYRKTGVKLYHMEEAKDLLATKLAPTTNRTKLELIKKHPFLTAVYSASGLGALTLGMFIGPAAGVGAIGLLATLALGGKIKTEAGMLTGPMLKKGLAKSMDKAAEMIPNAKTREEVDILKREYLGMAILIANMAELEYDATHDNGTRPQ